MDSGTPDSSPRGDLAPRPELVTHGDLAVALRVLRDHPSDGLVLSVDAPPEAPLREFLRARGRRSGGWLNRSWTLPVSEVTALAALADEHPGLLARLFRHDGASPADAAAREPHQDDALPARFWVSLDDDRRTPPERGLSA